MRHQHTHAIPPHRCVDNFFSAAAAALEFAAALKLRHACPQLPRPFRVPLGTGGLAAFLAIPFVASLAVMGITVSDSWMSFAICTVALLSGVLVALPFARPPSMAELCSRRAVSMEDADGSRLETQIAECGEPVAHGQVPRCRCS